MLQLDSTSPSGRALRVEFERQGDRYGHALSAVEPSGEVSALWESVEGDAGETWPPSPPLQSLRFETVSDGRLAALLLGMAGRGHWSVSIEPVEGEAAFLFDVACRATDFGTWLGSQYRILNQGSSKLQLAVENLPHHSAELVKLELMPSRMIGVRCLVPQKKDGPATTARWKYRVSLAP